LSSEILAPISAIAFFNPSVVCSLNCVSRM